MNRKTLNFANSTVVKFDRPTLSLSGIPHTPQIKEFIEKYKNTSLEIHCDQDNGHVRFSGIKHRDLKYIKYADGIKEFINNYFLEEYIAHSYDIDIALGIVCDELIPNLVRSLLSVHHNRYVYNTGNFISITEFFEKNKKSLPAGIIEFHKELVDDGRKLLFTVRNAAPFSELDSCSIDAKLNKEHFAENKGGFWERINYLMFFGGQKHIISSYFFPENNRLEMILQQYDEVLTTDKIIVDFLQKELICGEQIVKADTKTLALFFKNAVHKSVTGSNSGGLSIVKNFIDNLIYYWEEEKEDLQIKTKYNGWYNFQFTVNLNKNIDSQEKEADIAI